MLTRRAAAVTASQQETQKLQTALLELKKNKELCAQLLNEREENEKEMLSVLDDRDKLKKKRCQLEKDYIQVNDERAQLQETVDRFADCSAEYKQVLRQIDSLEKALFNAHEQIYELQEARQNVTALQTQNLFDEVVGADPQFEFATAPTGTPIVTIDLTKDTQSRATKLVNCSKNKLKKYIK